MYSEIKTMTKITARPENTVFKRKDGKIVIEQEVLNS